MLAYRLRDLKRAASLPEPRQQCRPPATSLFTQGVVSFTVATFVVSLTATTVDNGRKVSDVILNWWKLIGQRGTEVKSEDLKMRQVLALSSGRHIIMHENCLTFCPLLLGACEQQRPSQRGIKMYELSVKRL